MRLVFSVGILCLMVRMCCFFACAQVSQADQNVNMVSGTDWTTGDPFLERQNEPSNTVSTRNSLHLLAGNNDDRTVDLPGLLGIQVIWDQGDAQRLIPLTGGRFEGKIPSLACWVLRDEASGPLAAECKRGFGSRQDFCQMSGSPFLIVDSCFE